MNINDALPQPEWTKPQLFYGRELTFNPRSHRYQWDGQWVPSVTTIISRLGKGDALIQWAANCAVEHVGNWFTRPGRSLDDWGKVLDEARKAHTVKKDKAADIGTRVHEYAKLVLQGKNPPDLITKPVLDNATGMIVQVPDEQAQKAVEAFWRWVEAHKIEPHAVERRVMSAQHLFAGTTDFYGLIDGKLCVLDFKTGKGVYDEAWWQTAAYAMALGEELGAVPRTRWVVHLDKETGECTAHCRDGIEDHNNDMSVWTSLLTLDKALRAARKHPQARRAA